jgi:hypothetical protein
MTEPLAGYPFRDVDLRQTLHRLQSWLEDFPDLAAAGFKGVINSPADEGWASRALWLSTRPPSPGKVSFHCRS